MVDVDVEMASEAGLSGTARGRQGSKAKAKDGISVGDYPPPKGAVEVRRIVPNVASTY